jgi:hypothetical protein
MAPFNMSKRQAHILFLVLFDIPCLVAFWYFFNEIRNIFLDVINHADLVSVGSKDGFFIFAIVAPTGHLIGVIEHFSSEFVKKHTRSISYGFLGMLILLFVSAFTISAVIKAKVENAGYKNCEPLEWSGTYSKSYAYTRDQAICDRLVAKKDKEKQAASVARP